MNIDVNGKQQIIIEMLADGHKQDQIAAELALTQDSIAYHVRRLKNKLQAKTLPELIAKAMRSGILS